MKKSIKIFCNSKIIYNLATSNNKKKNKNMKTLTLFIIASIGMLTASTTVMIICLVLGGYLFYRYEINKKPQKVQRSESAFSSVANKECECDNPCNENCYNERISSK